MADPEKPKTGSLTGTAAKASCAMFLTALVLLIIGLSVSSLRTLENGVVFLTLAGFFVGTVAFLGSLTARTRDILAAVAGMGLNGLLFLGSYPSVDSRPSSPWAACVANLKQMQGAKASWALECKKTTNDIPTDKDLFGTDAYIRIKPSCPSEGIYRIGNVGQKVACSIPGHTL